MRASQNGAAQCVRLLVEAGADMEAKSNVRDLEYGGCVICQNAYLHTITVFELQNPSHYFIFSVMGCVLDVADCSVSILGFVLWGQKLSPTLFFLFFFFI